MALPGGAPWGGEGPFGLGLINQVQDIICKLGFDSA